MIKCEEHPMITCDERFCLSCFAHNHKLIIRENDKQCGGILVARVGWVVVDQMAVDLFVDVDDTFVIIKRSELQRVSQLLNNAFDDIKFTTGEENNGKLAFLDILIARLPNGQLQTEVFRKATHTDQVLSYHSNHPNCHKRSCIRTLFKRIETHCSTTESKIKEEKRLYKLFQKNGYPRNFIWRTLRKPNIINATGQTASKRVTLPYIKNTAEMTARLLRQHNTMVAYKPANTLRRTLSRPKGKLHPMAKNNVIYRIQCKDCDKRIHEHKLATKRHDQFSLISAQKDQEGHEFDWNGVRILAQARTKREREFMEACYHSNHPNCHKRSCIRTLFKRIETHCSTTESKIKEEKRLYKLFQKNGYPRNFIWRTLRKPNIINATGQTASKRVTLPYIKNTAEMTARLLRQHNTMVAYKPANTLRRTLSRPKGKLDPMAKNNVIYRIQCKDCDKRIHEHKLATKRHDQFSLISAQKDQEGHEFDWNGVRILAQARTKREREFMEAWYSTEEDINKHIEIDPIYQPLRARERQNHRT
ncbi:hypothetical protein T265_00967 [Opisthorchis viverrini]|uniref:Helix-turn-helix domain-containing protein n=1 Tax=Opisthorchis viverrini TaxID=6198 RepID=A0A075A025_OPIVI|nr:hypothetical protein T265_00967 [Opisthorchis viverrini]KER33068.1 hypothetical protein T265_00967 [Opisthorchis viverrini]